MGEKYYKPMVKDGDHLIHSKDNPERVRGLTRDENNQNPDIIEWEEYDLDDLVSNDYTLNSYEEQHEDEQDEEDSQLIANIVINAIIIGAPILFRKFISPWFNNTALPWLKKKSNDIRGAKEAKVNSALETVSEKQSAPNDELAWISSEVDKEFEPLYFEMNEDEAKSHIMSLVYHMLGAANEIRILCNARIINDYETEEMCIEHQKEAEKFLSEKVAAGLDQLLSNESLQLDLNTSRELYSLTGGGIHINDEYVPVQVIRISEALKAISEQES